MDNRAARIEALRRYVSLLRQEEIRLNGIKHSPTSNDLERESAEAHLHISAKKIVSAEKELRDLEKPSV